MKKSSVLLLLFFSFTIHISFADTFDFITTFNALEIKSLNGKDPRVKVFPNPANEFLNIEVDVDKNVELEIIIYNAIGKAIFTSKEFIGAGVFTKHINFEDQPAGIYFVNVKAGEIKTIERVIKIK